MKLNKKMILDKTSDFMIVILPLKDKLLAFQIHSNLLMSSNHSPKFRLTIFFGIFGKPYS